MVGLDLKVGGCFSRTSYIYNIRLSPFTITPQSPKTTRACPFQIQGCARLLSIPRPEKADRLRLNPFFFAVSRRKTTGCGRGRGHAPSGSAPLVTPTCVKDDQGQSCHATRLAVATNSATKAATRLKHRKPRDKCPNPNPNPNQCQSVVQLFI